MAGRSSQILIVHENGSWRKRVSSLLSQRGFACVGADDWRDRVGTTATSGIDCVVLQVRKTREHTGLTTVTDVRMHLPECKVLALTPHGDTAAIRTAFRAGASDCLEEPVSEEELAGCATRMVEEAATLSVQPTGPKEAVGSQPALLREHSMFLDALAGMRGLCRRHGQPLSIMMLDIDRFRECNERHSPAFGDRVLSRLATVLTNVCRRGDIVARYQGDRFVAALPDARASQAVKLADRCRRAMRADPLTVDGRPHEITFSVGLAESTVGFIETERQLIDRARAAVDQAKHRGRDRTVAWNELLTDGPTRRDLHRLTIGEVSRWAEHLRQHVRSTYVESTRALVAAVEAKDPYTRAHSLTVAAYAEAIGKRMQLPSRLIETLRAAALLHDVGKIGVPDAILTKPGPLTEEEFAVIRRHPETALEILGHVSFLTDERPLILHHHERYDGTGYPGGLEGDNIPIGARILAVADALDTMFSPRTYKKPYAVDRVRRELEVGAGHQFDPAVTDATLRWLADSPNDFPAGTPEMCVHSPPAAS